jgi:hypothetical protein
MKFLSRSLKIYQGGHGRWRTIRSEMLPDFHLYILYKFLMAYSSGGHLGLYLERLATFGTKFV